MFAAGLKPSPDVFRFASRSNLKLVPLDAHHAEELIMSDSDHHANPFPARAYRRISIGYSIGVSAC
jgi:hypothetical protein